MPKGGAAVYSGMSVSEGPREEWPDGGYERYKYFANSVTEKERAIAFLDGLRLKGKDWAKWIDYCYTYNSRPCQMFRAYLEAGNDD